ncbi:MAG: hypothetical protein K2P98_01235 [Neisseriaceae bacterium]|nr:hypothetical protein [Neisseriaceae bacterium]
MNLVALSEFKVIKKLALALDVTPQILLKDIAKFCDFKVLNYYHQGKANFELFSFIGFCGQPFLCLIELSFIFTLTLCIFIFLVFVVLLWAASQHWQRLRGIE